MKRRRFSGLGGNGLLPALASLVVGLSSLTAWGAEVVDKTPYTLFNPTPFRFLRAMSPDRSAGTESPITVDAGHFQVETSFVDYTFDDNDNTNTEVEAWGFLDATNLRVGLLHNVELQALFTAWTELETRTAGQPDNRVNGFSDVQVRVKINLGGNDREPGETVSFAVMPFIQVPSGTEVSTDHTEGGFMALLGFNEGGPWSLKLKGEVDFVFDTVDDDYDSQFVHTVAFGFDVAHPLGAYLGYIGIVSGDGEIDYVAILTSGLTYQIHEDALWDLGVRFGLNDAADDIRAFTGITLRY